MHRLWHRQRPDSVSRSQEFRSLIDLGTASVRALVVELRQGQTHIWGHGQTPLEGGYGPDGTIVDREAVAVACDAALSATEEMTRDTFGHKIVPDRSLWNVPGWLCQGQTFRVQQRRSRPAKRISRREWLALQARLDGTMAGLSSTSVDIVLTAQVEGHTVTDAIGLQGELLALQAFVVSAVPDALVTLREVADALELDPPAFVSQARAAAAALSRDGLILDVGRWGTGATVTRLGQLVGSAWIPLGGQSFYRTLSTGFGLSPKGLLDFCQTYVNERLPFEARMAADAVLVTPVARWLDLTVERLAVLTSKTPLPHQVYLAGGASALPAVLQVARRYAWMHQLLWSRHPEVHRWQPSSVRGLTDHTNHTWSASDLGRLGLARLVRDIESR